MKSNIKYKVSVDMAVELVGKEVLVYWVYSNYFWNPTTRQYGGHELVRTYHTLKAFNKDNPEWARRIKEQDKHMQ